MDFFVLVKQGHREGEGHLRHDTVCGVLPVSEDEATLASAYAGFGVLFAGAFVRGLLAAGARAHLHYYFYHSSIIFPNIVTASFA